MNSFGKKNLQNIKNIFAEKTGIIPDTRPCRHPGRLAAAAAALLVCCLGMPTLAYSMFSSLSGDDLAISAVYEGDGVISVRVENRSDKELNFESRLKLMRWSDNVEIQPLSGSVDFTGTKFQAHTDGIMTLDLSEAYDMDALEQPLVDDHYFLVLTNNNFIFGQDWMCTVEFAESPVQTVQADPDPIAPAEADPALTEKIMEELKPYFADYISDPGERNRLALEYQSLCQQLLGQIEGTVVAPVSPMELTMQDSEEAVLFDSTVPSDMQLQLTGLHRRTFDGYGKLIGASDLEQALVLSAYIPQKQGDIDGGVDIPLRYVFIYEADRVQNPQDYAFVRGQLLTFEQMEQYRIYGDTRYVCYDVTDLFYSDLRSHVESMVSQRTDVYFDEQIWTRVQNIDAYYRENMGKLLGYR